MKKWIQRTVRYVLTLLLLYMAYRETGFFTAIVLLLVTFSIEIQQLVDGKRGEMISKIVADIYEKP